MNKFKIGDRVEIIGNHFVDGSECWDQGIVGLSGTITSVKRKSSYSYNVKIDDTKFLNCFLESDLKLINKSLTDFSTLEAGDLIINMWGYKRYVLEVFKNIVYVSDEFDGDELIGDVTGAYACSLGDVKARVRGDGWVLYQQESVEETEELTMEEVCEELGRTIKIKK